MKRKDRLTRGGEGRRAVGKGFEEYFFWRFPARRGARFGKESKEKEG